LGSAIERRFLIVAGEASADAHAARLVHALGALGPARVRGVVGPALAAAGAERLVDMNDLAVIGFSGVVARLPRLLGALRRLIAEAETTRPDAAVLVDSPGFNFRLGPALRKRGIRVFYYIAPQVWAWHPERARTMARWVDRLAVVFPFEEPLFRAAGVTVKFVGHPLLDQLAPEASAAGLRRELGLGAAQRMLGILPGSRRQEIHHHLPALLEAARRLSRARPDLATVLPLAPGLEARDLEAAGVQPEAVSGDAPAAGSVADAAVRIPARVRDLPGFHLVRGRTRAVQAHATACVVASGTATLETALLGTPHLIVYRTGRINYWLARRLVTLERIGLPNVVAGVEVAPELLQGALEPGAVAETLAPWLDRPEAAARARERLAVVRERLGTPGASRRAAEWLWEMVA
jgi:lipid-A-disaccharide synthase